MYAANLRHIRIVHHTYVSGLLVSFYSLFFMFYNEYGGDAILVGNSEYHCA